MAAKGSVEKDLVTKLILETFDGAFVYGKEIRVPVNEVQIKITLTCAKDNVSIEGAAVPASVYSDAGFPSVNANADTEEEMPWDPPKVTAPTQEELDNVQTLMQRLGL